MLEREARRNKKDKEVDNEEFGLFGLVGFYGISTIARYLMLNPLYIIYQIYIKYILYIKYTLYIKHI